MRALLLSTGFISHVVVYIVPTFARVINVGGGFIGAKTVRSDFTDDQGAT